MPKRTRVPTEFGKLFLNHLAKTGMSQREFAIRVGRPNTVVNRVIYGERRPNPLWMAEWVRALGLSQDDSSQLHAAARAARAKGKADSAEYIEELTERLGYAEDAVTELWAILQSLGGGNEMPENVAKTLYAIMEFGKIRG